MTSVPALAEIEPLAVILQFAGIGSLIGTFIAYGRSRRNPKVDAWTLAVRWSMAGVVAGILLLIGYALT